MVRPGRMQSATRRGSLARNVRRPRVRRAPARAGRRFWMGRPPRRDGPATATGRVGRLAPRSHPVIQGLEGRIGLVLGSGAARGWAHVGVIRALEEAGLVPEIVCGSSSGAVIGALYVAGKLDRFERWGRELEWRELVGYFDLSFRGGLIKARKLFEFLGSQLPDQPIETLDRRFGAVATDLATGQEVWLREGSLIDSLRASIALPGLITPLEMGGRWLVDGGLVNPVPVSLCRALGADTVVAVDLNSALPGRRLREVSATPSPASQVEALTEAATASEPPALEEAPPPAVAGVGSFRQKIQEFVAEMRQRMSSEETSGGESPPSLYEVITSSINIMQVRISRSRMAGDPPELLVTPRLGDFALLDFDRASEAIDEGRRAVARALAAGAPTRGAGDTV